MYAVRRNGYGTFRRFLFSASLALCASLIFTGCASAVSGPGEMSRSEETAAQPVPAPDAAGVLKVHFIDVGQGDSILIQSGAENMLWTPAPMKAVPPSPHIYNLWELQSYPI